MNDYSIALKRYFFVIWDAGGNVPPLLERAHRRAMS